MASTWCKRCGDYDVWGKGCTCELAGYVWKTEDGESQAKQIWSKHHDASSIVREWAIRRHHEDHEFLLMDDSVAFSFRPIIADDIKYVTVHVELSPHYTAEVVDDEDDAVAEALAYLKRSEQAAVGRKAPEKSA